MRIRHTPNIAAHVLLIFIRKQRPLIELGPQCGQRLCLCRTPRFTGNMLANRGALKALGAAAAATVRIFGFTELLG